MNWRNENNKWFIWKSSNKLFFLNCWQISWADIDFEFTWGINTWEILSSKILVDTNLNCELSDWFFSKIDLNWEDKWCCWNVSGCDWFGAFETTDNFSCQNSVTIIFAIIYWSNEFFWKIVESDVKNNFSVKSWLSSAFDRNDWRKNCCAAVLSAWWSTITWETDLNFTIFRTSVTIDIISIITW